MIISQQVATAPVHSEPLVGKGVSIWADASKGWALSAAPWGPFPSWSPTTTLLL